MTARKIRPPKLGEILFRIFYRKDDVTQKLGDFEELFRSRLKEKNRNRLTIWYFFSYFQVHSLRNGIIAVLEYHLVEKLFQNRLSEL